MYKETRLIEGVVDLSTYIVSHHEAGYHATCQEQVEYLNLSTRSLMPFLHIYMPHMRC